MVDLLLEQHQEARACSQSSSSRALSGRREPFEQLVRLLAVHETAEEEVVYPAVGKMVDDGDTLTPFAASGAEDA